MTRLKMKVMAVAIGACCAGYALAGAGDITRQEQSGGSVELSNLGPEDAKVVVAAPAKPAVEAPLATSIARVPPQARVAPEAPVAEPRRTTTKKKRKGDGSDEEDVDGDVAGAGPGDATRPEWASSSPYAPGYSFGGAPGGAGYSSGAGSYGGTATGGTAASGPTGSTAADTGGSTGSTTAGTGSSGTGTTSGSPLDSPETLAARLAQYQQMMLNEQRGANGLVANPAVQRRYLMMNRSTYNRLGL